MWCSYFAKSLLMRPDNSCLSLDSYLRAPLDITLVFSVHKIDAANTAGWLILMTCRSFTELYKAAYMPLICFRHATVRDIRKPPNHTAHINHQRKVQRLANSTSNHLTLTQVSSTWYHPGFQDFWMLSCPDIWFLPSSTPDLGCEGTFTEPCKPSSVKTLRVFCAYCKTLEQIIEYHCHVALRRICATTWVYFLYRNPCLVCVPLRYPTDTFLRIACNPPSPSGLFMFRFSKNS